MGFTQCGIVPVAALVSEIVCLEHAGTTCIIPGRGRGDGTAAAAAAAAAAVYLVHL